ncbi:MAG: diadenylate cyclase CdaA [Bacillota bacterium]|nr:diadenylate cyclase CdaA [Bacillota bacterium]
MPISVDLLGLLGNTPWDWLRNLLDVLIVTFIIYRLILLIRGTRALLLVQGLLVLFLAGVVSRWLDLRATAWLLNQALLPILVALPIVFQPELRRALEEVGSPRVLAVPAAPEEDVHHMIHEVGRAVAILSRQKIGALIVIERQAGLEDVAESGIRIDGRVSAEFLVNTFIPNTPLHDGAVLIRGARVVAAACFLPLTEARELSVELGSRHRAALGITEHSDALAVVVSEETGSVTLADGGKLVRNLSQSDLEELLARLLPAQESGQWGVTLPWARRNGQAAAHRGARDAAPSRKGGERP